MIRSLVWIFLCCQMANAFYHSPTSSPLGVRTALRVEANDRFDIEELRQRIQQEASPKLFPTPTTQFWKPPETAHVILFHPGTEQQGAHTIEFPKGSGNNVMLAFESSAACHKFAQLLKQQHFLEPTVRCVLKNVMYCLLEGFCGTSLTSFFRFPCSLENSLWKT